MTYTCKICGTTSDASEFYAGVTSRCKNCHKAKVRENRANNVSYYREYDAKRFQDDPKVKARILAYQLTAEGKAAAVRAKKKWMANNAEKRAAHVLLGNAVRDNRVIKPQFCENCGATGCKIHGHHTDYARPLDVQWLCPACHRKEHK